MHQGGDSSDSSYPRHRTSPSSGPNPNEFPPSAGELPAYSYPYTLRQPQFASYLPYIPSSFPEPLSTPAATYSHLQQPSSVNFHSFGQPNQPSSTTNQNANPSCPPYEGPYDSPATDRGTGICYNPSSPQEERVWDGVYRYDGGGSERYCAGGTGRLSWLSTGGSEMLPFGNSGKSTSFSSSGMERSESVGKIVRAMPKEESCQDLKTAVQSFRVIIISEGGESNIDVLCQAKILAKKKKTITKAAVLHSHEDLSRKLQISSVLGGTISHSLTNVALHASSVLTSCVIHLSGMIALLCWFEYRLTSSVVAW